jgi:hypothetical protein
MALPTGSIPTPVKAVLRPIVRRIARLTGRTGRPSTTPEAIHQRWRTLSSDLVSAEHFQRAGLPNIWDKYPGKYDRQVIVVQMLRNVVEAGVDGAIAEFGCFRGHTAIQMVHTLRALGDRSPVLLFDSFKGMPASDLDEDRYWSEGAMTADLREVTARFRPYPSVRVVPGFFADTLPEHDLAIKFAHIDCDLASSVRDVHRWLLDRMAVGGAIVYDDYGFESCFGLMHAVNEDVASRVDYHSLSLPTGQCVAIRTAAA